MSYWQMTKPPSASPIVCRRSGKIHRLCNCGRSAVAKATVRVGLDGCYTVTLYLCPACLAIEKKSDTIPPPLLITNLD